MRPILTRRPLGRSGVDVSVMSLGSWRTFERISREDGLAVMGAAEHAGINFLDDARYDDETGTAPIPTGYSEVVFGELFRRAGWRRDEVIVANKLWWEFWPREDAVAELDGSLGRMRLDHVDLIYATPPPAELPMFEVVGQVSAVIESGRARFWGTSMWSGDQVAEALDLCSRGAPVPVAAQMACSLVEHAESTDPAMLAALDRGGIGLVAASVLAGGTLTGKYLHGGRGRASDDESPTTRRGRELAPRLVELAERWGVSARDLAFAYALEHPNLASIVFGATSPEQVDANVGALATHAGLDEAQRRAVADLAVP